MGNACLDKAWTSVVEVKEHKQQNSNGKMESKLRRLQRMWQVTIQLEVAGGALELVMLLPVVGWDQWTRGRSW